MIVSLTDEDLIKAPNATLLFLKTVFPQKLKQEMKPEIMELEKWIERSTESIDGLPYAIKPDYMRLQDRRLIIVTKEVLPQILEKAYLLIHEA